MAQALPGTVGWLIERCAGRLDASGAFLGHGADRAIDEAATLVYAVAGLPHDDDHDAQYARSLAPAAVERVEALLSRRIDERVPLAYLLTSAWFCGLEFFVDERVLVPRSPFAELIECGFEPWADPGRVRRILEIGTGSGCIAIACALAFPEAEVVAGDISAPALEVAAINVARHQVGNRVRLVRADLFDGIDGEFDLIVSNPPYVPESEMDILPDEYHHEPPGALYSGADGLASVRRIMQDARGLLDGHGLLAVEVGAGAGALEAAFPGIPFVWPSLERGGEGIALIDAADLAAH